MIRFIAIANCTRHQTALSTFPLQPAASARSFEVFATVSRRHASHAEQRIAALQKKTRVLPGLENLV
jgi:hypothetical protein